MTPNLPYGRYRNGTPAGGNLVKKDLQHLEDVCNNLGPENIRTRSINDNNFDAASATTDKFQNNSVIDPYDLIQENIGDPIDYDTVGGRHATEIGTIGVADKTVTFASSGMTEFEWRHSKDYYNFFFHPVTIEFVADDFGLTALPMNYRVSVMSNRFSPWTFVRYGRYNGNNRFPTVVDELNRTTRMGLFIVTNMTTAGFSVTTEGVVFHADGWISGGPEYATWRPSTATLTDTEDLQDWSDSMVLTATVTGKVN